MRIYFIITLCLFYLYSCGQSITIKEVEIINPIDNITLSGSLTLPKGPGPFPGVVLVAGTGKMDRDQTFEGHKFFKVLADYLAENGIASYRYDKRGVGKSSGDFKTATLKAFSSDAFEALKYLKSHSKISYAGFIGHSEGGKVAPMATLDNDVCDFLVLMAPPGLPADKSWPNMTETDLRARGIENEVIQKQIDIETQIWELVKTGDNIVETREMVKNLIRKNIDHYYYLKNTNKEDLEQRIEEDANWFVDSINFDEMQNYIDSKILSELNCPVFAITGDKDLFVVYPNEFEMVKILIKSNSEVESTFKVYPGLNHLFQNCETGLIEEVSKISETMDAEVMFDISEWIKNLK
ncbi:alpha/beta hydrolase [uncultured Eudoraea sp.]|uniref:alpha/beta hydrolase family protein n=1 Tax=uncultured Eudoraea sp. TaxID=1035614 RepID=UPI0026277184|nr:alpha/beta hydrolase [uncultured Eudoraea sp.]